MKYKIGDVVYLASDPDHFGRVFSCIRGEVKECLPEYFSYLIKSDSFSGGARLYYEYQLYDTVEEVVEEIRNSNADAKHVELYNARLQMKYLQEHIDAWEGFDPKTVRIEMEENYE